MSNKKENLTKIIFDGNGLFARLPITMSKGKVRLKDRNVFYEYGKPVAARSVKIPATAYIEWQIGYDLEAKSEDIEKTTLPDKIFTNYKGIKKVPYELAEILFFARKLNLITDDEIKAAKSTIQNFSDENLLENYLKIWRSNPVKETICGIDFQRMEVKYPLLVRRIGEYEALAEILVTEKQRAVGIQPMLCVCIPVKFLKSLASPGKPIIGRRAEKNECAAWKIEKTEARFALEIVKLFGLLSRAHRHDILTILGTTFPPLFV